MNSAQGRSNWRKTLLIGCGGLTFVAAALAVVVALNWDRATSAYQSVMNAMVEQATVRAAVQSTYNTPKVVVRSMRRSGVTGSILVIQLVNPPSLDGLPEDAMRAKATEVATVARDACPSAQRSDYYEILFVSQKGYGVTVSSVRRFQFTAADLPPRAAQAGE